MEINKPLVLLPYCVEKINKLVALAQENGFNTKVLKHEDEAIEIVRKYRPSYIFGVACPEKAKQVGDYMLSIGEKGEALVLDCETCFKKTGQRTKIDEGKYVEALARLRQKSD